MSESSAEKSYRHIRSNLVSGVFCVVFFAVVTIGSTAAAYWNVDDSFQHPKLSALILVVFWSSWTLFSIWCVLAYYRERLLISEESITLFGVVRTKIIHVDDSSHVKWRVYSPTGRIVIQAAKQRMKICLESFTSEERNEIVSFVRDSIASDLQDGWSQFNESTRRK